MLHIIGQYKKLLMASIMNYQDSPDVVGDALADKKIDTTDMQGLLELNPPEVQQAIMEKWQGELELTTDIAANLGDVTPDSSANNPTLAKQKTIQFLIALTQRIQGESPITIDGRIGQGTKAALSSLVPFYTDGVITQQHILLLLGVVNAAIDTKMGEQEASRNEVLGIVTSFDWANKDSASKDDIKALQTALQTLGYPIQTIDGVISPGGVTETSYQEEMSKNTLTAPVVQTPEEEAQEQTAEEALKALELLEKENGHGAIKAIQQALIDAGVDLGATGADGDVGPRTRAGIEAHPQVVLDTLATYIDTTDNATNAERVAAERPAAADAIDAALAQLDDLPHIEREAYLLSMASEFTSPSLGGDVRNKNAQYISLKLQELGLENDPVAQKLMEQIMAQGKGHYEQETPELQLRQALVDGSNRFAKNLARFPENFNGSYYKIGNKLQSSGGRAELEAGMKQGISGNANEILDQTFGVHADYLATRMHVVTGQGQDGDADMSLELGGGIQLSNAYYDEASGAIYAVVAKGNGCEGNLVVIPVEPFIPPVPRVVPRQPATPTEPVEPETPETGMKCRIEDECIGGTRVHRQICWIQGQAINTTEITLLPGHGETCGGGGDPDPEEEDSDTTTGGGGATPTEPPAPEVPAETPDDENTTGTDLGGGGLPPGVTHP